MVEAVVKEPQNPTPRRSFIRGVKPDNPFFAGVFADVVVVLPSALVSINGVPNTPPRTNEPRTLIPAVCHPVFMFIPWQNISNFVQYYDAKIWIVNLPKFIINLQYEVWTIWLSTCPLENRHNVLHSAHKLTSKIFERRVLGYMIGSCFTDLMST